MTRPTDNRIDLSHLTFEQAVKAMVGSPAKRTDSQAVGSDSTTEPVPEDDSSAPRTALRP